MSRQEAGRAQPGGSIRPPAPSPCGSCPYRRDVPSGVWSEDEYEKLPPYDGETWEQPIGVFLCHQQNRRACAGWASVHGDEDSFALRIAAATDVVDEATYNAIVDYESPVPLFSSGAEAAQHGLANVPRPDEDAVKVIQKLERRKRRQRR